VNVNSGLPVLFALINRSPHVRLYKNSSTQSNVLPPIRRGVVVALGSGTCATLHKTTVTAISRYCTVVSALAAVCSSAVYKIYTALAAPLNFPCKVEHF